MVIEVTFDVTDVYISTTVSPVYVNVSFEAPSGGGGTWGSITGTLSNQTDLQTALDGKFDDPTGTTAQYLRGDGSLATFPAIPSGTVQSVGLTMPSAFSVANSPITSSGTLAVTATGDTSQYLRGDGTLATFPSLTGYVPYTGATTNVDLGEYQLRAGQVTLDTSPTGTAAVGTTRWNDTIGSSETTLKGGSVILKNGVDLVARVVNKVSPNTTLTKAAYQAVRVSGAQGQRLAVGFAQANNDNNSADTIGLVTETIATNQEGFIITVGQLDNINTTGSLQGETWADGDVLYLSPTTAGALTNVKPNATIGHIVVIGYVEYAHANNGKIYVKVMNGWELDELHDVSITSVANNEALIYESSSALWKNKSIATALGYTPANADTTLTINGVSYDLSTSRTWSVGSVTGSGALGQVAYWTGTSAQSGSNNLFWDNANGRLGIGTATPSVLLHVRGSYAGTLDSSIPQMLFENANTTAGADIFALSRIRIGNGYSAGLPEIWLQAYRSAAGVGSINLRVVSNHALLFSTNDSERMRIFAGGNIGIGTGTTDSGQRLQVQGTTLLNGNVTFSSSTGMFWDATNSRLGIGTNAPSEPLTISTNINSANGIRVTNSNTGNIARSQITLINNSGNQGNLSIWGTGTGLANKVLFESSKDFIIGTDSTVASGGTSKFQIYVAGYNNVTSPQLSLHATGNLSLGSTTDSGERLQVTGTMKVTGLSTFGESLTISKNSNAVLGLIISNTTAGTGSNPYLQLVSDATAGSAQVFKYSSTRTAYKTIAASDFGHYNATAGDISFLNDFASGAIKFASGGVSTPHMTIKSNGRINMSSLPTSSTGLATGDLWNDAGTIKIV